jgi:hypothetical protein
MAQVKQFQVSFYRVERLYDVSIFIVKNGIFIMS